MKIKTRKIEIINGKLWCGQIFIGLGSKCSLRIKVFEPFFLIIWIILCCPNAIKFLLCEKLVNAI